MLTAQITGGLGNQMFTYARLAVYGHEQNIDLAVDGSIAERVLGRSPDLFAFKLRDEPRLSAGSYSQLGTQMERFLWRSKAARKLTKKHQEVTLGNTQINHHSLDGWKVRGFFQDYRVAENFLQTFGKEAFRLKLETAPFRELSESLAKRTSLAIHVRRGDYLNYQDSFGVLKDDYYLKAYESLTKLINFTDVLIFTDSPELMGNLQKNIGLESRVIFPETFNATETMILMSRCAGLITSNSTFSFWAGMIGEDLKVVIPNPWFRSTDPWLRSSNFENPHWLKQQAIWS